MESLEPARPEPSISPVICPQCKQQFKLVWTDYFDDVTTLIIRGCPSGGLYDVRIHCPHCDYEEEL